MWIEILPRWHAQTLERDDEDGGEEFMVHDLAGRGRCTGNRAKLALAVAVPTRAGSSRKSRGCGLYLSNTRGALATHEAGVT